MSDTIRRRVAGTAVLALALAAAPAAALPGGTMSSQSWWIVLDDRPETPGAPWNDPAFDARARACGLDPYSTQSSYLTGSEPGRIIVVHLRAFPSETAARAELETVRRCIPGASLRSGRLAVE